MFNKNNVFLLILSALYVSVSLVLGIDSPIIFYTFTVLLFVAGFVIIQFSIKSKLSKFFRFRKKAKQEIAKNKEISDMNLLMNENLHQMIEENKQLAKQAVMFDELFYESLDLSNQIIYIKDKDGYYNYVNDKFLSCFDLEKEFVIGKKESLFSRYKGYSDSIKLEQENNQLLLTGAKQKITYKKRLPVAEGYKIFDVRKIKFKYDKKDYILTVLSDITTHESNERQYNEEIDNYRNKLNKKNTLLGSIKNLTKIFYRAEMATDKEFEKLLINIFDFTMKLMDESDYGSIYIFEKGYVKYLKSYGFDIKSLNTLKIPKKRFFDLITDDLIILRNTEESDLFINEQGEYSTEIKESIRIPLRNENKIIGSMSFDISSASDQAFQEYSLFLMKSISKLINIIITLINNTNAQENYEQNMIKALLNMLEIHDEYTNDHSETVANLSRELGMLLELPMIDIDRLYWAGITHDIGKIEIPAAILNKKEKLTTDEFRRIKHHPVIGYKALSKLESLKDIAKYVLHHHERVDGLGYPDGLVGSSIPLISRILSVVDAWDAMTSERSYRKSLPVDVAIGELVKNSGTQFDEFIVKEFVELLYSKEIIDESLYKSLEVKL